MSNLAVAAEIGIQLIDRLMTVQQLQAQALAEKRDISNEEIDRLILADDLAKANLQREIDKRRSGA